MPKLQLTEDGGPRRMIGACDKLWVFLAGQPVDVPDNVAAVLRQKKCENGRDMFEDAKNGDSQQSQMITALGELPERDIDIENMLGVQLSWQTWR